MNHPMVYDGKYEYFPHGCSRFSLKQNSLTQDACCREVASSLTFTLSGSTYHLALSGIVLWELKWKHIGVMMARTAKKQIHFN